MMTGPARKLTAQQERRIRRLVALRKQITNVALAKRYNVSPTLISDIGQTGDFRMKKKLAGAGFGTTSKGDSK